MKNEMRWTRKLMFSGVALMAAFIGVVVVAAQVPSVRRSALAGKSMIALMLVGFALTAVGAVLDVVVLFIKETAIRRKLKRAQVSLVNALQTGTLARVTGTVVATRGAPLIAPLSKKPCVAYSLQAHDDDEFDPVAAERSESTDFFVRDASGVALVRGDAIRANLTAERKRVHHDEGNEDHRNLLRNLGIPRRVDGSLSDSYVFIEHLLEIGESCSVLGTVSIESVGDVPDSIAAEIMREGAYRDTANSMPVLSGTQEQPLLISEHDSVTKEN